MPRLLTETTFRGLPRDVELIRLIDRVHDESDAFSSIWREHDVAVRRTDRKTVVHPNGTVHEFVVHRLVGHDQLQHLLWLAPESGEWDQEWPITVDLTT
ncbi:hypothetical protein [Amnibacterium sp.]|uniref:MmyB family transcriptional regulator n=1 Tax=Amnibacterium sp. TaxID=1872496 RepID=UPI00262EC913|nr:hypothetical protein [Amnibacterium sp.]MCU1475136.1 transcriptional regulator [Amnibacterium sp.]